MEFIESSVSLQEVARAVRTTVTKVEADCHELSLFIGCAWDGRPAISVIDAARMVSGDARREHDHAEAHRRWRAASEAWEADREAVRRTAYNDCFNAARRRGVGDPAAAHEAAPVASAAVGAFEKATPPPAFGVAESPRLFTQMKSRVKEVVR